MVANIQKSFSGRWYYVSSRDGIAVTNWPSRARAVAAARAAGHEIIVGDR
jgi:hypothetical protein